jgi:type VI protein secretion system component VasK
MDTDSLPVSGPLSLELLDIFAILGAILLVVLIVFFWALMVRKRKNRIRKSRRHHRKGIREQFQKSAGEIKELVRQHQRGRHREHRALNPTLAQTGGLPPLREAEKPPPLPPPSPSP